MDLTSDISGRDPINRQDKGLYARFFVYPEYQSFQSEKEGRQVYIDKEFIEIRIPGDKTTVTQREATQQDKVRFEKQYNEFKNGQHQATEGTPLEEWSFLRPSQILPLKAVHVFTVEQLAELSDTSLQRIGPGVRELQLKARQWLERHKENEQLTEALKSRDDEIALLKQQLEAIQKQMNAPQADTKPKRGGRPKGSKNKAKENVAA